MSFGGARARNGLEAPEQRCQLIGPSRAFNDHPLREPSGASAVRSQAGGFAEAELPTSGDGMKAGGQNLELCRRVVAATGVLLRGPCLLKIDSGQLGIRPAKHVLALDPDDAVTETKLEIWRAILCVAANVADAG